MNDQIQRFRRIIRKNNIVINDQKNAIYWVAQKIDDHMELKKIISEKLHVFVKDLNQEKVDQDADIKKEYESQRNYLENCVKVLRKRQQAAAINSTNENKNIMEENRKWITMIGELTGQRDKLQEKFSYLCTKTGEHLKDVKARMDQMNQQQKAALTYQGDSYGGSQFDQ